MKLQVYCLLLILIKTRQVNRVTFDLTETDKHGNTMKNSTCSKDNVIDFYFSPLTMISQCGKETCNTTYQNLSTLHFLDLGKSQETYILKSVSAYKIGADQKLSGRQEESAFFKFYYTSGTGKNLFLAIPFNSARPNQTTAYQLNFGQLNDSDFSTLKGPIDIDSSKELHLSVFNVFNKRDLGIFYHLADLATSPQNTYLLSYFILSKLEIGLNNLDTYNGNMISSPTDYGRTADKICYGSASQGIFWTHLNQSYPLWTAWFGVFLYWVYVLLTESNTINCYDKKFENNKWTCWGLYSLRYLGHQDYFTKLSRTTLMQINFSWEGCVIAILYSQIAPGSGPVMILWAGIIGAVTAMPFTYVMGYVFLRKIYELTLRKYEVQKKMKEVFNKKDGLQTYENQVDDLEESLYGYNYWFYVLAFTFFTAFWVVAMHQMMQIHRDHYYFMHFWLASLGVALGFQHLFFDPLLTLILGNTTFYRIRGFFYDFTLGEAFKQNQE